MKKNAFMFGITIICLTFLAFTLAVADNSKNSKASQDVLYYYFDLISSGNHESAIGLWESSSLTRANRLGIEYENVAIKADCNSPVVRDIHRIREHLYGSLVSQAILDDSVIRWKLTARLDSGKIEYYYYTIEKGGYNWLISAADYYSRKWPIDSSKYFRFYINFDKINQINDIAIDALDNFVDKMAVELNITPEMMEHLAKMKIDYYLCKSENEIEQLSGYRDRGVYDPASDAVITTLSSDYYDVARLLINYKLKKLSSTTVAFINEGYAATLGGRWGLASGVLFDFGKYVMRYELVDVDSVLTYSSIYDSSGMSDIICPVAACLADYLYKNLGNDGFFALYNSLSGDYRTVKALSTSDIQSAISKALGKGWDEVTEDFNTFLKSEDAPYGLILPGAKKADIKLTDIADGLTLSFSDKYVTVEYIPKDINNSGISILLNKEASLEGKSSDLFGQQFGSRSDFEGYRWGIVLDKNEIGLYDYAANEIKAKYIDNSGNPTEYFDSGTNKISAYFDIGLIDGAELEEDDIVVVR